MRVALIGPCPNNIGGISMHLRRIVRLLQDECEFIYIDEGHTRFDGIFNLRSLNIFRYISIIRTADIVHINSGHFLLRMFNILMCKFLLNKSTIVTIHRNPDLEPCLGITRWLLWHCDHVILVNKEGYNLIAKHNENNRYSMQPAFLPPIIEEEPELPLPVLKWIRNAQHYSDHCILASNAWNLVLHNDEDLYGLDLCIEAAIRLQDSRESKQYYFIFVVASCTDNADLLSKYQQQIIDFGLEERFLIWTSPLSFVRLLTYSNVMLRTTNTDGDAISVREALYMGKTVIASDVVERPKGVTLFENRNVDSLVSSIRQVEKQDINNICRNSFDYKAFYLNLYKSGNETINSETP